MKNFSLAFLSLVIVSFSCLAQNDSTRILNKLGVSVQVNQVRKISELDGFLANFNNGDGTLKEKSYSIGITPYYFIKENFAIRIRGDITKININNYVKNSITQYRSNSNLTRTSYEIALGGMWQYKKGKIILGGGFEIPFGFFGDYSFKVTGETYSNGSYYISSVYEYIIPGGSSYGIGTFGNLNFKVLKNISAGLQLSASLLHYKIGGDATETFYDSNGNVAQVIPRELIDEKSYAVVPCASLIISITF